MPDPEDYDIGSGADPWAAWDGYAPISRAMIFGYWNANGYESTSDDETLIDQLHIEMGTCDMSGDCGYR